MPRYTLILSAQKAVVGQDVTATLRMVTTSGGSRIVNFKNGGLVLVLQTIGSQDEEYLTLPNIGAHMQGNLTIRTLPMDGVGPVSKGGTLERTFSLREYFPTQMQTPGSYAFSYRIEGKLKTIRVVPVRFQIVTGGGSGKAHE